MEKYLADIKDAIDFNKEIKRKKARLTGPLMLVFIILLVFSIAPFYSFKEPLGNIVRIVSAGFAFVTYFTIIYIGIRKTSEQIEIDDIERMCYHLNNAIERVKKYSKEKEDMSSIESKRIKNEIYDELSEVDRINADIRFLNQSKIYENSYLVSSDTIDKIIAGLREIVEKNKELDDAVFKKLKDIVNEILKFKKSEQDVRTILDDLVNSAFPGKEFQEFLPTKEDLFTRIKIKIKDEQTTISAASIWTIISLVIFFVVIPKYMEVSNDARLTAFAVFYSPILLAIISKVGRKK